MSKNSRRAKRRFLAMQSVGRGDSVPGGIQGALFRNYNGAATPKDIDFLIRMGREAKGKDGYTDMSKGNGSTSGYKGGVFTTIHTTSTPKDEHVFHCAEASEIVAKCPLNPPVPDILIPILMWECFLACCKEYDTEWIALLKGKLDKDTEGKPAYIIESFYFPPQVASGAHVDVPTGVRPKPGTIGAIHSHVDMGVFWSGTDTAHSNWPVEIVINRREAYEALSRFQLKCGEWAKRKSTVKLTGAWVSKAIDTQVMNAFSSGATLAKANKVDSIVHVHAEDKAEVKNAIVVGTVGDKQPAPVTSIICPTCKSAFKYVRMGPCADTWHKYDTRPNTTCPILDCTRDAGHVGWHRRSDETYFLTSSDGSISQDNRKPPVKEAEVPNDTTQTEITPATSSLTIPISDDPTVALEDYCSNCEGEGYTEQHDGNTWIVDKCPKCQGDGYSDIGRIRRAEMGSLLQ